jgi:hypothetical protein
MKAQIYVSYNYGGISFVFRKTFIVPFTPFFGMGIIFDDRNEYSINLKNDEYCTTHIDYNIDREQFEIGVRNKIPSYVSDEYIDELFVKFSSWERVDNNSIDGFKKYLLDERER